MDAPTYVSRLRWDRDVGTEVIEVPHAHGQPVAIQSAAGVPRTREWPNRLGILERGLPSDMVTWHRDLTAQRPEGRAEFGPGDPVEEDTLQERLRWFRRALKRFEQVPGVMSYVKPEAPCGVLLVPALDHGSLDRIQARFPHGVESLREVLPEFPGGLQLRITDSEWARAEEYAVGIEHLLRKEA